MPLSTKPKRAHFAAAPILILDENRDHTTTLCQLLIEAGFNHPTLLFSEGSDAVKALSAILDAGISELPAAIFADLKMSRYAGVDFLAWVSEQKPLAPVQKIALVPCVNPEDITLSTRFGAKIVAKFPSARELATLLQTEPTRTSRRAQPPAKAAHTRARRQHAN